MSREICGEKSFHFPSPPCLAHTQAKGLLVSIPVLTLLHLLLLCRSIGTGQKKKGEVGERKEKDIKKKESKNKLSAMNRESLWEEEEMQRRP